MTGRPLLQHTNKHTNIHTYIHTYIRTYIHTYVRTYIQTDRRKPIHPPIHSPPQTIHPPIHAPCQTTRRRRGDRSAGLSARFGTRATRSCRLSQRARCVCVCVSCVCAFFLFLCATEGPGGGGNCVRGCGLVAGCVLYYMCMHPCIRPVYSYQLSANPKIHPPLERGDFRLDLVEGGLHRRLLQEQGPVVLCSLCVWVGVYVYACMYVCMYVWVSLCIYIYMCVCG
jgi:hypothetical protein